IRLVVLDAGWDDVGSWTFMGKQPATDAHGNRARGDVMFEDAHDNFVYASTRLVALLGVSNQGVVETDDSLMGTSGDRVQDVKKIVQALKGKQRSEVDFLSKVTRPWGHYVSIANGERFQVKRLTVNPGHKLSMQLHHHRAEHWVVVSGTARVTCGEK